MGKLRLRRHDGRMAPQTAYVGNLFLVRWGVPTQAACARVQAAFNAGTANKGRKKPFYIAVLPHDLPVLDDRERAMLAEVTRDLLPRCAHVAVAIEARGFRGAVLRSAISAVSLSSSRHYGLSVVDSVSGALTWAPGPLPDAAELFAALEQIGCALPPAAHVA